MWINQWIHLFGASLLVGGFMFAALIGLPISKTVSPSVAGPVMVKAVKRLTTLSWLAIAMVVLTGLHRVMAVNKMVTAEAWIGSTYGIILLVKIGLAVATIIALFIISFYIQPALKRHHTPSPCSIPQCVTCAKWRGRLTILVWDCLFNVVIMLALAAMLRVGV